MKMNFTFNLSSKQDVYWLLNLDKSVNLSDDEFNVILDLLKKSSDDISKGDFLLS